jgi:ribosome biogenesis GTPase A
MKQIQWFPGHMTKALQNIKERLPLVDIVLELVDARAPFASQNPLLREVLGNKPRVIIFNKADLADASVTERWRATFARQGIATLALDARSNVASRIEKACQQPLQPLWEKERAKGIRPRAIRAMIVGVPNVGKSTLINQLAHRKAAQVGNKPGVTKAQQWIKVSKQFELLDTPGVLWPRFEAPEMAMRLAWINALPQTILPLEAIGLAMFDELQRYYPSALSFVPPADSVDRLGEFLDALAAQRGFLKSQGECDREKALQIMLGEIAVGKWGRFSFERPEDVVWPA